MKKQKGQIGIGTFITLLIAISIAIFLFAGGMEVVGFVNKEKYTQLCRLSIQKAHLSKFSVLPKGFVGTKLDCPRRYVTFYKDKIEAKIIDNQVKLNPDYKELSEETIKRGIAEELTTCWYMVGQGNYIPFDQKLMSDRGIGCIVCSIIGFDKNIPNELQNRKITGFIDFLKNKNKIGTKIKYYDYLKGPKYAKVAKPLSFYELKKAGDKFALDSVGEINTAKNYYVVYAGFIPGVIKWDLWEGIKSDLDYYFGIDLGKSELELGLLFFIEDEDLEKLNCGFLYN